MANNKCYCEKCKKPVTWFNFKNIWEAGKISGREHVNCESPEILNYKKEG